MLVARRAPPASNTDGATWMCPSLSAAIVTALTGTDGLSPLQSISASQPDQLRFAAAVALWFNVTMVLLASVAITRGMPKRGGGGGVGGAGNDVGGRGAANS